MRQIVYISTARSRERVISLPEILKVSQRNNLRAQVTGLLFFNGKRFLQAIEGAEEPVASTFARISADRRHYAMVTLSDRQIEQREFGEWAMAYQLTEVADGATELKRIAQLVSGAAPLVRATFNSFAGLQPAV